MVKFIGSNFAHEREKYEEKNLGNPFDGVLDSHLSSDRVFQKPQPQ